MDELTSKPLVQDMLDRMRLSSVLHGQAYGVCALKKHLECLAVCHRFSIWETPAASRDNGDQCIEKCSLMTSVCPEK